jgi:hypothetical protein
MSGAIPPLPLCAFTYADLFILPLLCYSLVPSIRWTGRWACPTASVDVKTKTKTSVPLQKQKLAIEAPAHSPSFSQHRARTRRTAIPSKSHHAGSMPVHIHLPLHLVKPTIGAYNWVDTIRQHRYASCSYHGNKMTSTIFGFSDVTWLP